MAGLVILHMLEIITSKSEVIKIGNKFDLYQHGLETRILITIVLVLNRQQRFNKKLKKLNQTSSICIIYMVILLI
jgi:hypothetical protein